MPEPGPPAVAETFVALSVPACGPIRVIVLRRPRPSVGVPELGHGGWPRPLKWVDTIGGQAYAWCGELRRVTELPENLPALAVAARLGCADLADHIGLRGDLFLTGICHHGGPTDVPQPVLDAAIRASCSLHPGEAG